MSSPPQYVLVACSYSVPDLTAEVAADLPFAPSIQALADSVIEGMSRAGSPIFNSLHLRVEADAREWIDGMGGIRVCGYLISLSPWVRYQCDECGLRENVIATALVSQVLENEYLRAMHANHFSPDIPVYVASGLLTYGADEGDPAHFLHIICQA